MRRSQRQILGISRAGVMEWHRAVDLAMHELMYKPGIQGANLVWRTLRDHLAAGHKINVIHDFH